MEVDCIPLPAFSLGGKTMLLKEVIANAVHYLGEIEDAVVAVHRKSIVDDGRRTT